MSLRDKLPIRWARPVSFCAALLPLTASLTPSFAAESAPADTAEVETRPDPKKDAGKGPWERVSTDDGILVERRAVPGTNLKEFRGRGIVEAPLGRVLAIIKDSPHRCEWMAQCGGDYVVEENEAARWQISYHRTKAPWPVADRDSINRAELRVDLKKHRVFLPFEAIEHAKVPPVKDVVRMPFLRGHWTLEPVGAGGTIVEYQVHADPGGNLPEWIANLASKKLPLLTIVGLRKQSKVRTYPDFERQIANSDEAKQIGNMARPLDAAKPPAAPGQEAPKAAPAP
jgi:hypothetical protein